MLDEDSGRAIPTVEQPYGTIPPTSPFYIKREADSICQRTVMADSPFTLYIQAPRQVGKSSLMQRICHQVRQAGKRRLVYINFESFEQAQFSDLKGLLVRICLLISDQLGVKQELNRFFDRPGSKLMTCSNYLSSHIMPR